MKTIKILAAVVLIFAGASAMAHSGGTNSAGCHTDHKTGLYHCH